MRSNEQDARRGTETRPELGNTTTRRLIDAKEAGLVLGCSWRTVLRLADAGKIPQGYKLGSLRRWDAAELDAFIASGCKPPRPNGARR